MIVEAIFWFHPLVWWLGARLIAERERACDEAVLGLGSTPRDYAEAILSICKTYLESPLAYVSGVTGASLKKRIQAILTGNVPHDLGFARKVALSVAGLAVLTLPIAIGILGATNPISEVQSTPPKFSAKPVTLQSFELGPGTRSVSGFAERARNTFYPGYYQIDDASLRDLIQRAYALRDFQVVGGLSWIDSHDYKVTAKAADLTSVDEWRAALQPIFQKLLQDRFKLASHYETQKQPVYILSETSGGNKLRTHKEQNCGSFKVIMYPEQGLGNECGAVSAVNQQLNMQLDAVGMNMTARSRDRPGLVDLLSGRLGRPMIDKTGLIGQYDFRLEWNVAATNKSLGRPAASSNGPSIFDALRDQLGLELKAEEGPVRVMAVDHAERPVLR